MKNKILWLSILALMIVGAGCAWLNEKTGNLSSIIPSGNKLIDFSTLNSTDAAKVVNFTVGSQIEIRQTYLGQGAKAADEAAGDDKTDVRIVTIERFAPDNYANLSWKLSYDAADGAATGTESWADENGKHTVQGSLENIDLKQSHRLDVPGYWPSAKANLVDSSAIWLSKDVFDELSKNLLSTIYYGILDQDLYGAMNASKDFSSAVSSLLDKSLAAQATTDPDLTRSDAELSDWPLKVNGQDISVQVIKAHNWYGDIVVLNNPQNPLVLRLTLNPTIADGIKSLNGGDLLASIVGYEVTRVENVQ
ncbi:MAG: hypothetical protein WCT54_02860 [Patescibacteria group bacterium]